MQKKTFISGIILAAGFGKRAECDKLLLPWKSHTLLFEVIKHAVFSHLNELIIVIQHRHLQICQEYIKKFPTVCSKKIKIIVNTTPEEGMAASLRLGVQNCYENSNGALFLLTDQPFFNTEDINAIYTAYKKQKSSIMAAYCGNERKNPVLFSLEMYKEELLQVTGDKGARELLTKYADRIDIFPYAEPLKFIDIDTQVEYQKYKEKIFSWCLFFQPYRLISLIGAGGKTSLMWNIAEEMRKKEEKCIFSTTTKLWNTVPKEIELTFASDLDACKKIVNSQTQNKSILLASRINSEQKLLGINPSWFESLMDKKDVKFIVEADGAKGKYFKVHAPHEPCIPHKSDLVIIVFGMDIIGKKISGEYIHRFELFSQYFPQIFPMKEETKNFAKHEVRCSTKIIANILNAPSGYFSKTSPPHTANPTDFILFLNHVENKKNYLDAMQIIKLLKAKQNPSHFLGVLYGSNITHDYEFIPF